MKNVIDDAPTSFLDQNTMRPSLNRTQKCSNHVFLLEQQRNYWDGKHFTRKQWRSPTTWKNMLKNVLSDTANWQTRKWTNFTKLLIHVLYDCQGGIGTSWRIVKSLLTNCHEKLEFGKH